MITHKAAAEFISAGNDFLIITHRNPDGDTLGSAGALCMALRNLGKNAVLLENPQTTDTYAPEINGLTIPTVKSYDGYIVVAVDLPSLKTVQLNYDTTRDIDLVIDHHASHSEFGVRSLIFPEKSSCGEVVLELLRELNVPVTVEIARLLYIALSTDTGCFRYKNTTAASHLAAAELIIAGAPAGELNHKIFTVKRLERMKLESEIINTLELLRGGELAIAVITLEMLSRIGVNESDLDDIANIALQPEGVEMAVTLREELDGCTKISVRTVNYTNANKVCMELGGGGHGMAAGVNLKTGLNESKQRILVAINKWWGIA